MESRSGAESSGKIKENTIKLRRKLNQKMALIEVPK